MKQNWNFGKHCWPWLFWSVSLGILTYSMRATAADQVVLKYGPLKGAVSVTELRELAETGKTSPELQAYLKLAKQDPQAVRSVLTRPVKVDALLLDRLLNNPVGGLLLDEVSQVVHPPAHQADRQALRSAIALSASSDQQLTLLEAIENYPTPEVEVEGDRLVQGYRKISQLAEQAQKANPWVNILTEKARSLLKEGRL
jgi:hypothetical protein